MALQFSTAKDEVAERLRNTGTSNKTRVGEWLNIAMNHIIAASQDWDWLQAETTWSISSGTQDYTVSSAIASDVDRIFDVRIESDGGWRLVPVLADRADRFYPDEDLTSSRPEAYTLWGDDTITVYPDPDANYTAVVRYYKTISDLSNDTDTPPWPRKWDYVWLWGAEYYGLEYHDDRAAGIKWNQFRDGIKQMRARKSRVPNAAIVARSFSRGDRFGRRHGSPWPVDSYS